MYISGTIELGLEETGTPSHDVQRESRTPLRESSGSDLQVCQNGQTRYPDQGLVVRSKIAEINGLDGPENVLLGNGSSEVYDNIFRCFLTVERKSSSILPALVSTSCAVPFWAQK